MFEVDITGFGLAPVGHLVSNFTGTLSVDGKLLLGVKGNLNSISKNLKVHIITADTFGKAWSQLKGINCEGCVLEGSDQGVQKATTAHGTLSHKVFGRSIAMLDFALCLLR
jgi:soluble P-type ATPase